MLLKKNFPCGELRKEDAGKKVILSGWVLRRRDHGGLVFIDLQDRTGIVQVVFNPELEKKTHREARKLREGWVISVEGKVTLRPRESVNPKLKTGEIEVMVTRLEIHNSSLPLPFLPEEKVEVGEEVRLKYRYLDLRRPPMQRNLKLRYEVSKRVREFLDREGFMEIETPFLTRSTPEGARDYLVPSRLHRGEFYALPQSPQLFKQILMVAGYEKYFQIVRCFRDEDLRADRQPEHTQIDIELSFVEEEDIYNLVEKMLQFVFEKVLQISLPLPFPHLPYQEAMERFGTDKPDLRFGMEIKDFTFLCSSTRFEIFRKVKEKGGKVKGITLPGGRKKLSREGLTQLTRWITLFGAKGLVWMVVTPQGVKSPVSKFFSSRVLKDLVKRAGANSGDIIFLVADREEKVVTQSLGNLRVELAKKFGLIPSGEYQFTWVVDFPLFERDEEGNLVPCHHPFTSPREEDISLLEKDPEKVKARAYDIVLNGEEIGGGSIRIHQRDLQERIFKLLGIDSQKAREKFGFLLEALSFGAPPHGGIALGLDRLVMLMCGASSIREVIPFPKTQRAICLLSGAPTPVEEEQLKELHLKVEEE